MPRILPQVLRNLFRKPATVKYPKVRVRPAERYRGKPIINKERCTPIRCGLCVKACPTGALSISEETKLPRIDLGRCLFCGECAECCPRKAIVMSLEFELATYDKHEAVSE
jgi:formate hydrogenlyase subunit 6/NADH:ubiquinone oxidoreductase subunit I